ncbi:hypothetical protein [Nonomuraea jabiensis]|uniref:hypothetical protein n=1 Tax=Nonomuraea jabiensis TaxID=882448 RepID=UPI003D751ACF
MKDQPSTTAEIERRRVIVQQRTILIGSVFWLLVGAALVARNGEVPSSMVGGIFIAVVSVIVANAVVTVRYDNQLYDHRQQATLAYEKLLDVQDDELETRLSAAAQRLHNTSRELAELQLVASHRAELFDRLRQRSTDARRQAAADEDLAAAIRSEIETLTAIAGLRSKTLERLQRGTSWFFFVLASVGGFFVGLLTNWVYDWLMAHL